MVRKGLRTYLTLLILTVFKIEKALEETAKETEKSGSQPPIKPAEKNKPTSSALRGVPQFLLDKVSLFFSLSFSFKN